MPSWLKTAVFYEIYPQSFNDTNADGIGDFKGIIEKLDYIKELGCNALWINPCFDSPFKDAGYDVRDYCRTAQRYGSNEDLCRLFDEAHARGIRVLLDLVPGHTSEEHAWFLESQKAERNEFSDRYVWTDFWIKGTPGYPYIGGECERNGVYMLSFFKCQPALNYGWKHPVYSWQQALTDPGPLATREAMKDVMRFWLSRGCDGFRVDMADSLAKGDDEQKSGTCEIWRDILSGIRAEFPEAAFVSEWGHPEQALTGAGFDMDFYLNHPGNGYSTLMRDYEAQNPFGEGADEKKPESGEKKDRSYFKKDAGGDIMRFLDDFLPRYEASCGKGFISFITCNHDTTRPSFNLDTRERMLAFSFLMTMPGVPFIYYGDEIGMRFMEELPTKEGGYTRTGSRTPMQWNASKNMGFSEAPSELLYLPTDSAKDAPNVAAQEEDPGSLLQFVRRLLAFRAGERSLQADAEFAVLYAEKEDPLFVWKRGDRVLAVNPSGKERSVKLPGITAGSVRFLLGEGRVEAVSESGGAAGICLTLGPQSFLVQ